MITFQIFFQSSDIFSSLVFVPPPALGVDMVHVRPGLEQELDAGEVAGPARRPQRSPLFAVMKVDLSEARVIEMSMDLREVSRCPENALLSVSTRHFEMRAVMKVDLRGARVG